MKNKVLFLDRDGVINVDYGHVGKIENFHFIDGIFKLCKSAIEGGYKIIVVTNQAGIAKEKYTLEDFLELTSYMIKEFSKEKINIDAVYFCPYHNESKIPEYKINSELQSSNDVLFEEEMLNGTKIFKSSYRKPHGGMISQAAKRFDLDLSQSIFIGDKYTDILASINVGVGSSVLIGKTEKVLNNFAGQFLNFKNLPKSVGDVRG